MTTYKCNRIRSCKPETEAEYRLALESRAVGETIKKTNSVWLVIYKKDENDAWILEEDRKHIRSQNALYLCAGFPIRFSYRHGKHDTVLTLITDNKQKSKCEQDKV